MTRAVQTRDLTALAALEPKPQVVVECASAAWLEGLALIHGKGGDLNASWRGYRALHALMQGDAHQVSCRGAQRVECLRWLLAHGANPELTAAWPPARAFLIAAFTGIREYVGLLPRSKAIFDAAALGDTAAVRKALKRDPEACLARDSGGLTALQCAAASRMEPRRSLVECAALLIDGGAEIAAKTKSWSHEIDAAYLACNSEHLEMFLLLLERGGDPTAALAPAAWQSDLRFSEAALTHGASIDRATNDGKPLLNNLIRWGRLQRAEWLLARGASPNVCDARGWNALHQAASRGSLRMVELLLEAGADARAADCDGALPHDVAPKPDVRARLLRAAG